MIITVGSARQLISRMATYASTVADLNCGQGMLVHDTEYKLSCSAYWGFDKSAANIALAMLGKGKGLLGAEFACVDVLAYKSDRSYDVVVYDAAGNDDQLAALHMILSLWSAGVYVLMVHQAAEVGPAESEVLALLAANGLSLVASAYVCVDERMMYVAGKDV